jgi:hypothetical protein
MPDLTEARFKFPAKEFQSPNPVWLLKNLYDKG